MIQERLAQSRRILGGRSWGALFALVSLSCALMAILQGASAFIPVCGATTVRACPPQARLQPAATTEPQPTPVSLVADGFRVRTFRDAQGRAMTYYLYIPAQYDPHKTYPLVLLLHGGGEGHQPGNTPAQDQEVLLGKPYVSVWTSSDPDPYAPRIQERWPSFIVVPQAVAPNRWVNVLASQGSYTLAPQPTDSLLMVKEILDALQRQYTAIDANRLYVTGISMGGYGVWDAIERWPDYFAAAAPIAGAGDPQKAAALVNMPIWAFHGAKDIDVPVSGSRDMVQAIKAAGGRPRYSEYPDDLHEVWLRAYGVTGSPSNSPQVYAWLFSQDRRAGEAASG